MSKSFREGMVAGFALAVAAFLVVALWGTP